MFFQTHLGIEMALCAEVWLIGPDIEAWPDRTRFFWCLSNQHCALTYPTHNSTELPLFSVRQYAIHIISTFFIYQITAGCVADDPAMESLYIPVDHLLVHYIPLQESSVKISPKNVDWKFDQLSGWTHPRLNRGGATLSPDKIHCSWSYGGEEEVDWCSQWIPRIPMPGPVFLSWSSFQLRSTFRLLRWHLAPAWNKEGSNQLAQIEFCIYPDVSLVCKVLSPILTKTLKSNGQTIFCKDKKIEDMQCSQLSGYHRNSFCFKIMSETPREIQESLRTLNWVK